MKHFESVAQLLQAASARHPRSQAARAEAHTRWAACAKPLGSLGVLEEDLEQIAAATGSADVDLSRRAVLVFCADNGVIAQGVTQCGPEITTVVANSMARGTCSIDQTARVARCGVVVVDMGILDYDPDAAGLLNRRIANGTADFTSGPAMTRAQAEQAILAGAQVALDQVLRGKTLLATGELGMANTTTAAAVASVLLGVEPESITGRGAGLSDEGLARKVRAIETGLAVNAPDPSDPIDVLAKVGGFDIAAMCGAFLAGAACHVPVLADGLISTVAALCALRLCPECDDVILASHVSAEPAGKLILEALGKKPLICAGMRLGEGTGAVAAMPLLDIACAIYGGATFAQVGMEAYVPQN
ncbi:MAG: nicotinate-nucleotide--dimethylbenzimidazole phosphoribosyltransferase [Eubacteriales bacterium]|nr:nicotinate-nucleotide--dimethylbenzimidazole phosphoribosyltransferase [Eubacteriales bacterium]